MIEKHEPIKKAGMTPLEIREAIYRKGLNMSAIARNLDVSAVTVKDVINGRTVSKRVQEAIAEAISVDIRKIWPELYLHGGPKRGRPKIIWNRGKG
jgi:lambda repressor-like predicted transcriptional regulator